MKPIISNYIAKKVGMYLPRKIKRLVYVSSILALIDDIKAPSNEITRKLNVVLGLGSNDSSIALPMYIHSFIWSTVIKEHREEFDKFRLSIKSNQESGYPTTNSYKEVISFFCNNAPEWLRYGSAELLSQDLKTMFNIMPMLNSK